MKECSKCGEKKSFSEYYKCSKSKDNFKNHCKSCEKIIRDKRYRTKEGLIVQIFKSQKGSSRDRGMDAPLYTEKQLKSWVFSQKRFNSLYSKWVSSGYKTNFKPSIDRKDDYKGYSFDNIKLMTWKENKDKGYLDKKEGRNNKVSRAVLQFDLEGNFIKEYYSIHNASISTNTDHSSISDVCKKKTRNKNGYNYISKTAGGYIWKYKKEDN